MKIMWSAEEKFEEITSQLSWGKQTNKPAYNQPKNKPKRESHGVDFQEVPHSEPLRLWGGEIERLSIKI